MSGGFLLTIMLLWRGLGRPSRVRYTFALLLITLSTARAFVVLPHVPRPLNVLVRHGLSAGNIEVGGRDLHTCLRKPLTKLSAALDSHPSTVVSVEKTNCEGSVTADIGFSFSVAGLFFAYHLGVAEVLREKGLLHEQTPLAGSSGGALAAVAIALGLDGRKVRQKT